MISIIINYQDTIVDEPQTMFVAAIPRIGEKVCNRPVEGQDNGIFHMDYVVDVRHYDREIHVLTSSRP